MKELINFINEKLDIEKTVLKKDKYIDYQHTDKKITDSYRGSIKIKDSKIDKIKKEIDQLHEQINLQDSITDAFWDIKKNLGDAAMMIAMMDHWKKEGNLDDDNYKRYTEIIPKKFTEVNIRYEWLDKNLTNNDYSSAYNEMRDIEEMLEGKFNELINK